MKLTHCLLNFALLLMLSGCSFMAEQLEPDVIDLPAAAPVPVEYTVLHKADYNLDDSETVKSFSVLKSEEQYRAELARYSVEVPKAVDFNAQRIVLATMGTQPAGGYAVGVHSVLATTENTLVTIELRSPGVDCINTAAQSNPYEFTLIETIKPVEFAEVQVVQECE